MRRGGEDGVGVLQAREGEDAGVAQVGVVIGVGGEQGEQRRDGVLAAEFAEGLRGEKLHALARVGEEFHEAVVGLRGAGVAEDAGGLRADFRIGVGEQREQRRGGGDARGGSGGGELAEAPDAVETRDEVGALGRGLRERGEGRGEGHGVIFFREGELGVLADALVAVREEAGEFGGGAVIHAFAEEAFGFLHERAGDDVGFKEPVDAAFAGAAPTLHPVAEIEAALDAELHVGDEHFPEELGRLGDFIGRAFGAIGEGEDAAGGGGAPVGEEEMVVVTAREAGAGIEGHAARTRAGVAERRQMPRGLAGVGQVPEAFGVPRTREFHALHVLITNAPAVVGALDDLQPARAVADVGVVVAHEEIAAVIEGQRHGIAQAPREQLGIGAVEIAAEDAAAVGAGERAAVALHMKTAVAHAEVKFAVGAEAQAVQLMARVAEVNTETVQEGFALDAFARLIFEPPDIGRDGEPDVAIPREHALGGAGEGFVETTGEHGRVLGLAVAIAVLEEADDFGDALAGGRGGVGPEPAHDVVRERRVRGRGEVVIEPVEVRKDRADVVRKAMALADEEAAFFINAERDGVLEVGFVRDELDLEAGSVGEFFQGALGLLARRGRDGFGGVGGAAERSGGEHSGERDGAEEDGQIRDGHAAESSEGKAQSSKLKAQGNDQGRSSVFCNDVARFWPSRRDD